MRREDFLDAGFDARCDRGIAARSGLRRSGNASISAIAAASSGCGATSCSGARTGGVSVWLAGISLGGFMALDYAATPSREFDGLCLLAPYLGNRMLTAEIAGAPGARRLGTGRACGSDVERRIWRYVKTRVPISPPLYLGYGQRRSLRRRHALMAEALPAGLGRRHRRRS